ncbi:MAG TPA: hypothetical protein VFR09_00395, partial [Alphaproteobacteria bacterium]|nr:hypothetical protein [Alphaproteobacteria bacterium]
MTSAFRDWLFKPPYKGVPWIVWCYVALSCLVVTTGGVYKGELTGFDDPVRMTQVLNWVNGAGWYDRTITRVNAPDGFTSIWSRLVDIPIALVILIAQQFVAQKKAALIASVVIPFTELALLFPVMRYFARPLVGKKDAWLVVLFLLFTTVTNFNPFSVAGFHTGEASHHSWYVILDLLMFGAVARIALGVIGSSPALMMGGAAGGLLAVGIEGLPMIAGSVLLLGGLGWYCNRPALPQRGMQALIYATLLGLILL